MASDGFLKVCTMEDLRVSRLGRLNISLNGRIVTVVVYKEKLYCMDTICYHAGGNLYKGDIEEVNGVPCLTCPIHHYRLSLKDGKQASFTYEVVDDKVGPCFLHFPPKEGTRQRVHPIKRVDDDVYVKLDDANKVLSDRLAFKKELLTQTGSRVCTSPIAADRESHRCLFFLAYSQGCSQVNLGSVRARAFQHFL
ncbi:hypothetical protein DIPPA_13488 [Diplonema papillatum]|nr:hypothetical protein DIPPA_13488 [Diplonema papillatum]